MLSGVGVPNSFPLYVVLQIIRNLGHANPESVGHDPAGMRRVLPIMTCPTIGGWADSRAVRICPVLADSGIILSDLLSCS